jgi:hypothetical protein
MHASSNITCVPQLEELRQIAFDAQRAMQQQNLNTQEGKNIFRRIFDSAASGFRRLGCTHLDDIIAHHHEMPEAPSSRPSLARPSEPRLNTTPISHPRQDSSLLQRSHSCLESQRRATRQVTWNNLFFSHVTSPFFIDSNNLFFQ